MIIGTQLFVSGFLGELVSRNSPERNEYFIDEEINRTVVKIISVGPAHPLRGGIAKFNESLAAGLLEFGHQIDIISYKLQYPSVLFPGKISVYRW